MEFITAVGSQVARVLVLPITRPFALAFDYIYNYDTNIQNLSDEVEKLKVTKTRVQHQIDEAKKRGEKIEDDVEMWWRSGDSLVEEASKLAEDANRGNNCFMDCPSLMTRYQLSRKGAEIREKVVKLQGEGKFERVGYVDTSQSMAVIPVRGFEAFESRASVCHEIMEALKDINIDMVGIYGLSGVGKTTLVEKVAEQMKDGGNFDLVVLAVVSHVPDLSKIQDRIADGLKFKLDAKTVEGKAVELHERLKKVKKMLIILDDIWERLELRDVGIPLGTCYDSDLEIEQEGENRGRRREERTLHKACKILMTSTSKKVLSLMGSKCNFQIQVLPDSEAWNLFEKGVGEAAKDPSLQFIAAEVAKQCGGLPILLVSVARALKDEELSTWKDALERLRMFENDGIVDKAYLRLELSYKLLKSEEIKSLFLLCGMFPPHDILITDLLKYTVGLGIFRGSNTIEHVRNRLQTYLNGLKSSCLLLEGSADGTVKMHDVVHSFAVSVANKDHHFFVPTSYNDWEEWPDNNMFAKFTAFSSCKCKIPEPPVGLECPQLKLFHIHGQDLSFKISNDFFKGMRELKVLDLSDFDFPALPLSLQFLENLQTLCLDYCSLSNIGIIGLLKKLQVLSLTGSDILQLPKEIAQLTRLRLLDLSNCSRLEVIPPDVLSCLVLLEDLCMKNSFQQWEDESMGSERNNASLRELKKLSNLITLDVHIPNGKDFPKDLFFNKLERFRILIGDEWDWSGEFGTLKTLKLKLNASVQLNGGIKALMERAGDLSLQEVKGVKGVVYELDGQGFHKLKHLRVKDSLDIEYIVNPIDMSYRTVFPRLESLFLEKLNKLEKICGAQLPRDSLRNLRILRVERCNKLNDLFSSFLARSLVCLEEIRVIDCENIQALVSEGSEKGDEEVEFTKLRRVTLKDLPHLTSVYSKLRAERQELLAKEYGEGTHMPLLNQKNSFPNLEDLKLVSIKVGKIWHEQSVELPSCLQHLTSLTVEGCGNFNHIFTTSVTQNLQQLRKLEIGDCELLKEIVLTTRLGTGEIMGQTMFPKLDILKLCSLPKLKTFCTSDLLECPSLRTLWIENCPELKAFIANSYAASTGGTNWTLFDEKVVFPNLEELHLRNVDNLTMIWHNELHSHSFRKLRLLKVEHGKKLMKIFPSNTLRRFQNVENLKVTNCDLLEEVFDLQMLTSETDMLGAVTDSQLRYLYMWNLPNLKHVWDKDPHGILTFQNLQVVSAWECPNMRTLFPVSVAMSLQQLEVLEIRDCGIQEIVSKEEGVEAPPAFVFPKVTTLVLVDLPELKRFYPGMCTSEWPMLKILIVHRCDKFPRYQEAHGEEGTVQVQQPLFSFIKIISSLEDLSLSSEDTTMIRQYQFFANKLKTLRLMCFHDGSEFFPFDILKRFQNLKELRVICSSFKELFSYELLSDETHTETLAQIRELTLDSLSHLRTIWNQQHPQLDQVLQNLETLQVWRCNSLINLAPGTASFQNLKNLDVWKCKELRNVVTSSSAKSLSQLRRMSVRECDSVTEIVANDGDEGRNQIVFSQLEALTLECLLCLTSFCTACFSLKFPSLRGVIVTRCPKMQVFSQGVVSTPKLQMVRVLKEEHQEGRWEGDLNSTIEQMYKEMVGFCGLQDLALSKFPRLRGVWKLDPQGTLDLKSLTVLKVHNCCWSLRNVFNLSVAICLVQLLEMEIKNCAVIEEVITEEAGEAMAKEMLFPKLSSLLLECLPNLTSFYSGNGVLECPSLQKIFVLDCPKMATFASTPFRGKEVSTSDEGTGEKVAITVLFNDQVVFPNLEKLHLRNVDNLTMIWHNELHSNSFRILKLLKVEHGKKLKKIFPSNTLRRFQDVEELRVTNCDLLEEVFDLQMLTSETEMLGAVTDSQLRYLFMWNLPNLKHAWNKDPKGILSFQNLRVVSAQKCPNMRTLFPISVAMSLQQLEVLEISDCGVEEIVSKEEGVEAAIAFVFPKVTTLKLWELPELKSFSPGMHTSEWPMLKILIVCRCEKFPRYQEEHGEEGTLQVQQPLFSFIKIISSLEDLTLSSRDTNMIRQYQFSANKLKSLTLACFHDRSEFFPIDILRRFQHLKELWVFCSYFEELFSYELLSDETHTKTLTKMGELGLRLLPNLRTIWNQQYPQLDQVLQNLETLKVWSCDSLINLMPSTASFRNLKNLDIWKCKVLRKVVPSSTAKSLSQLRRLSIVECESVTEIVANDEHEARNQIVFSELKELTLECLPCLTSFCTAYFSFNFPSLVWVTVTGCPKMEVFSRGVACAPELQRVRVLKEEEGRWEGDLNSTVEQMYKEMESACSSEMN